MSIGSIGFVSICFGGFKTLSRSFNSLNCRYFCGRCRGIACLHLAAVYVGYRDASRDGICNAVGDQCGIRYIRYCVSPVCLHCAGTNNGTVCCGQRDGFTSVNRAAARCRYHACDRGGAIRSRVVDRLNFIHADLHSQCVGSNRGTARDGNAVAVCVGHRGADRKGFRGSVCANQVAVRHACNAVGQCAVGSLHYRSGVGMSIRGCQGDGFASRNRAAHFGGTDCAGDG